MISSESHISLTVSLQPVITVLHSLLLDWICSFLSIKGAEKISPTLGSADSFSEDFQNLSTVVAPSVTGCRASLAGAPGSPEILHCGHGDADSGVTHTEHREEDGVGSSVAPGQSVPRPGLASAYRSQYGSSLPSSNSTREPGEEKPPKI